MNNENYVPVENAKQEERMKILLDRMGVLADKLEEINNQMKNDNSKRKGKDNNVSLS